MLYIVLSYGLLFDGEELEIQFRRKTNEKYEFRRIYLNFEVAS